MNQERASVSTLRATSVDAGPASARAPRAPVWRPLTEAVAPPPREVTRWHLAVVLGIAALVRLWGINEVGFNSDEAVYAGQAAAIASDPALAEIFPIFRAHPLLFQVILSLGFHLGIDGPSERIVSALIGVATVYLVYELGKLLYGPRAGLAAALLMALMPYHVVVTRQVLLDGPMTLCATLVLYLLARFALGERRDTLYAAGAALGLTFLAKETSILFLGAVYAFFALSPDVRLAVRDLAKSTAVMAVVIAAFPLTLMAAGGTRSGESYLAWQLSRLPNHDWTFYFRTVPAAIGPLVIAAALLGLWLLRRRLSWRETLLVTWIAVPTVFFQLWPVKGFQYLLPIAPPLAVLAGSALTRWSPAIGSKRWPGAIWAAPAIAAVTLAIPTWEQLKPPSSTTILAGSGGVPGGRETGEWLKRNIPQGSRLLTVGPSMANILQFYGHRKAYGLSVSPNPLHRNPSYEHLSNPDKLIATNELQYVVWDSFSAARATRFADGILRYADRYNGRVVHTESVTRQAADGSRRELPIIVVYEVRP